MLALSPTGQAKGPDSARSSALEFLEQAVRQDGGWAAHLVEVAVANGLDPQSWPTSEPIADQLLMPDNEAPFIALLRPLRALALAEDPGAQQLAARVTAGFDGEQFGSPQLLNDDAYAILALRAAGRAVDDTDLQRAAAFLLDHRNGDGGWSWIRNGSSGTDMTGIVLQALASLDAPVDTEPALSFLDSVRITDGFAEQPGQAANCESTAWALRIQQQAHQPPDGPAWNFLLSLQNSDGGFSHLPGGPSDVLCTTEVATVLGFVHTGQLVAPPREPQGAPALGAGVMLLVLACIVQLGRRIRQT